MPERKMDHGKCIIVSAPSGAGKTTVVHHLLALALGLEFSVSACSRKKRGTETDGKDYYFISTGEFKKKISENAFVEWEEVYSGHFYGTLKSEVERIWQKGNHVVFDVDVVGGLKLKKEFGGRALALYIMPPSVDELEQRLRKRETDSGKNIDVRMQKARQEMARASEFDKVIVNDNLSLALHDAEQFVRDFLTPAPQ